MKRFLITVTAAFLICCYSELCGLARVCVSFVRTCATASRVYSRSNRHTVLCVGASHIGSSISEKSFIKSMWLHSTSAASCLVRVLELERRGQLKGFKYCVLETSPFDYAVSYAECAQSRSADLLLRELPINWRYFHLLNVDVSHLCESIGREVLASRASFTSTFELDSSGDWHALPKDRLPMSSQSEEWRQERLDHYIELHYGDYKRRTDVTGRRMQLYGKIKEICDRYNIRVVVFSAPLAKEYRNRVPCEAWVRHAHFLEMLKDKGYLVFDRHDAFGDEFFFDPTHLANLGTEKFTEELLSFLRM